MPWDQRGEKRYYYRKVRRHGRSVRIYCGTGSLADLAATADALLQVQREMDARQWRQGQEHRAAAETLLVELCEQSDVLVHATLIVAGYHQHDRGTWRRKREREPADGET
ncbi:MAG TPA: hypothetical protein VH682_29795 [Gemmataceae bacterium]|jgi:hypothetical protein